MKQTAKHIVGYIVGISIILLIPWWQYLLSLKEFSGFTDELFDSDILRIALSGPVFLLGILFGFWSNYYLFEKGKGGPVDLFNVPISPRSKTLLVTGPSQYCRNPMVFGAICIYTSIGLYVNSVRSLLVVCGFIVFMYRYVKIFEETRLLRDFGDAYRDYKKRVSMLIPFIKMKKICCLLSGITCFWSISFSQEKDISRITDEIKTSIELHLEAIKIMDSLSQNVWPGWDNTEKVCYFIGAPENNAVFINPGFELPKGFIPYTNNHSEEAIFVREKSNLDYPVGSTSIFIDGKTFSASSLMPFSIDEILYTYFDSELEKICHNETIKAEVKNYIRSPEFYVFPILHETFHFYQEKKKIPAFYCAKEPLFFKRPRIFAYSYIEGMLLQNALSADTKEQMTDFINQFIAVRYRKGKELVFWKKKYEKADEFVEGTAQYITYKFSDLLEKMNYQSKTGHNCEQIRLDFRCHKESRILDSLLFTSSIINTENLLSKQYYYGQAQAILLDRLCGDIWKKEIMETNVYLIDLLIKYSLYDKKKYKSYLEKAIDDYRYKDLLKCIKNAESEACTVIDYQ